MRIRTAGAIAGGAAAAAAAAVAAYPVLWRRWCLTWGATADEAAAQMPGDDLMPSPDLISTRAITVEAPPGAIWPWLVQMGSGRGGAYTYDWIENLSGLGMHSANEILPQFQDLKVGDVLPLGSQDAPRMRVEVVDRERALVVRSSDGNWVWVFGLYPEGKHTRLVSRNRIKMPGASAPARLGWAVVMEPGSLVMERKMLLGIKQRAEHLAATPEAS
jgi:hypothetical protein